MERKYFYGIDKKKYPYLYEMDGIPFIEIYMCHIINHANIRAFTMGGLFPGRISRHHHSPPFLSQATNLHYINKKLIYKSIYITKLIH